MIIADLRSRLANRVQLTTDGNRSYLNAVEGTFGADVDYAMLVKQYGEPAGRATSAATAPLSALAPRSSGSPAIQTYLERQNLTMRMGMRRFTRLTNGSSKRSSTWRTPCLLHYMHDNFARPHKTLTKAAGGYPTTPAMAAGVADHVWSLAEIGWTAGLAPAYAEPDGNP